MNPWPFILSAYGIAAVSTLVLLVQSYLAMRGAEAGADDIGSRE